MLFRQEGLILRRKYLAEDRSARRLFMRIAALIVILFGIAIGMIVAAVPDARDPGAPSSASRGTSTTDSSRALKGGA